MSLPIRLLMTVTEAIVARSTEVGSRNLVWAATGGVGRESELRGGYVSTANLSGVSDYALSDEGTMVQTRIWVRELSHDNWTRTDSIIFQDESVEILSGVEPKFESSLRDILSS